jgi:hypothetical protein
MFDEGFALDDPAVADSAFGLLVAAAGRGRAAGRFAADRDPEQLALRYWAAGHGLTMLVLTGVLPVEALLTQSPEIAIALFVAAGDEPDRCARSVRSAWSPRLR